MYHAFGNPKAPVVFIGINSAGDGDHNALNNDGRKILSIEQFHEIGFPDVETARWGENGPPPGPTHNTQTYRHQARILDAVRRPVGERRAVFEAGYTNHIGEVRNSYLGRAKGPSLHTELYFQINNEPPARNAEVTQERKEFLRESVLKSALTVCYGWGYRDAFQKALEIEGGQIQHFSNNGGRYIRYNRSKKYSKTDIWIVPFFGQGQISLEDLCELSRQLDRIQWQVGRS